jgi:hypothetical protein
MAAIAGVRGSGSWTTPDEAPKNYHEALFKLVPDAAPFYGLMSKLKHDTTDNPEFILFEERLPQMYAVVNGSHNNSVTTININGPGTAPGKAFKSGDLLRNVRTGETLRLTATPSDPWTSLTVATRGSWGGGAAAMNNGDILRWVGSAYAEATTAPDAVSQDLSTVSNYVQDFQDSCEISDIAGNMYVRPEDAWKREKRLTALRHMLKIETALFFGRKVSTTGSNGQPLRGTGGLIEFLSSNVIDHSSSGTSLDLLEDACQQLFKYGSKTKVGFAGNGAINRLNRIVRNNVVSYFDMSQPLSKRETYGLDVRNFSTPFGTIQLIPHPLLTEDTTWTNQVWIVDLKNVAWVTMKGIGQTKWEDNIKTDDGYTGRKGRYRTVAGLRLALEEVHGILTVGTYVP